MCICNKIPSFSCVCYCVVSSPTLLVLLQGSGEQDTMDMRGRWEVCQVIARKNWDGVAFEHVRGIFPLTELAVVCCSSSYYVATAGSWASLLAYLKIIMICRFLDVVRKFAIASRSQILINYQPRNPVRAAHTERVMSNASTWKFEVSLSLLSSNAWNSSIVQHPCFRSPDVIAPASTVSLI